VYIVTFTHTSVPERQQIDINIDTFTDKTRGYISRFPFPVAETTFRYYEPRISFRISYTARTWGSDIENLLKDHIKGMIIDERSRFRRFIRKRKNYLLNVLALFGIAILARLGMIVGNWITAQRLAHYNEIVKDIVREYDPLVKKIDFIYANMTSMSGLVYVLLGALCVMGAIVGSYIAASYIMEYVDDERPSFVVLTRRSESKYQEDMRKYERNWKTFIAGFTGSVTASVIGNVTTWMFLS
jgi:hypothetical protein